MLLDVSQGINRLISRPSDCTVPKACSRLNGGDNDSFHVHYEEIKDTKVDGGMSKIIDLEEWMQAARWSLESITIIFLHF